MIKFIIFLDKWQGRYKKTKRVEIFSDNIGEACQKAINLYGGVVSMCWNEWR